MWLHLPRSLAPRVVQSSYIWKGLGSLRIGVHLFISNSRIFFQIQVMSCWPRQARRIEGGLVWWVVWEMRSLFISSSCCGDPWRTSSDRLELNQFLDYSYSINSNLMCSLISEWWGSLFYLPSSRIKQICTLSPPCCHVYELSESIGHPLVENYQLKVQTSVASNCTRFSKQLFKTASLTKFGSGGRYNCLAAHSFVPGLSRRRRNKICMDSWNFYWICGCKRRMS